MSIGEVSSLDSSILIRMVIVAAARARQTVFHGKTLIIGTSATVIPGQNCIRFGTCIHIESIKVHEYPPFSLLFRPHFCRNNAQGLCVQEHHFPIPLPEIGAEAPA